MSKELTKRSRKFGANRNEFAKKQRTQDRNFSQSRDIHEDRGQRRIKTAQPAGTAVKIG
jgi:hypothetical protein